MLLRSNNCNTLFSGSTFICLSLYNFVTELLATASRNYGILLFSPNNYIMRTICLIDIATVCFKDNTILTLLFAYQIFKFSLPLSLHFCSNPNSAEYLSFTCSHSIFN